MRLASLLILTAIFCTKSYDSNAQITLTKNSGMFFGSLDYDATHSGTLQLGTDNNITLVGGVGISHDGSSTVGSVTAGGTPADVIEIKCTATGKMKLLGSSMDILNTEIAIDSGVAFGSGFACAGNRKNDPPATTVDLAVNPSPVILVGGEAIIPANSLASGTYVTFGSGTSPITIRVIFQ